MKLRFTPRALLEAKRIKTWWQAHRHAAPDLFEREFEEALSLIVEAPALGTAYGAVKLDVPVRRVLLEKTRNHVYYAADGDEVVILSVWGAPRERGPRL